MKYKISRSNICDVNGEWLCDIRDIVGGRRKSKLSLEYVRRNPSGVLQDQNGRPLARLSSQSVVKGTRLLLFFINPKSCELVLGIKAMMAGDSK